MESIAKTTKRFVESLPFVKQGLRSNIINYSKLSRLVIKETGLGNKEAIVIACRRLYRELKREQQGAAVTDLLKGTKLIIRDRITAVILEADVRLEPLLDLQKEIKNETVHIIRGANAVTVIATEDLLPTVKRRFANSILKVNTGLVEILMKSSVRLESVPGVMGYLYSLFGENGVNIAETMSCWTDTIFVIKKADLPKVMGFLNF